MSGPVLRPQRRLWPAMMAAFTLGAAGWMAGPPIAERVMKSVGSVRSGAEVELAQHFARLRRAASTEEAGRIEADIYIRLAKSSSPSVEVLMRSAGVAAEEGRTEEALAAYREIIALEPGFAEAHTRLAFVAYGAGNLDLALAHLKRAVAIEPRHFAAWTGLATVQEESGRLEAARDAYEEALFLHPLLDTARRGVLRVEAQLDGLAM